MQISASQWNNLNSVNSVSATNNSQSQYKVNLDSSLQSTPVGDDVSISSQGGQMAGRMQRMRPMDSTAMEDQMEEMNSAIEELELDSVDVDEMSREELESKVTDISSTLNDFRPEDAPEQEVDIENLTDDQLKSMITGFSNSVSQVDSTVSDMSEMADGGMPPMGGPQGGPPPPPPSATGETEETDETELIDTLIAALETDETTEEESSEFLSAIYSYLDENGLNS